jgi:hypothetical protein
LNNVTTITAVRGIWTPSANVLCFGCHGNTFNRGMGNKLVVDDTEMQKYNTAGSLEKGYGITKCDRCGCDVQLDDSVASEHNIMFRLREAGLAAEMYQTGSMSSACGISTESGGYYLITFNWDGDGHFVVGEYDAEGCFVDNPNYFVTQSMDDLVEHVVQRLTNAKRITKEQER